MVPGSAARRRGAPARGARGARVRAALAAAAAIALAFPACDRGREPLRIESIRVAPGALAEDLRDAGLAEADLAATARRALEGAGFRTGASGRGAWRARLDVLSIRAVPTAGPPRLELAVELELVPARAPGDPLRESARVSRTFGDGGAGVAWRQALEDATARAAAGLAIALAAEARAPEALRADLRASDPRVRAHAARVLGGRGDASAAPLLLPLLEDDHPEVVEHVVGALGRLGDERAVEPLIDLSRRRDPLTAARYARVIGSIGGDEARGYLLTIESGHPDPRVRRAAREALAALEARAGRAPVAHGR